MRRGCVIARTGIDERFLVRIWERQLVAGDDMITGSGDRVQVIYPGRENRDSGPDFKGAVIATGGGRPMSGDVELHLRAGDWRSHGHQNNPQYNDVILQVVWEGEAPAPLQNGKTVPTLSLCRYLKGSLDEIKRQLYWDIVPDEPCYNARRKLGDIELSRLLDEAGEQRFCQKVPCFAADLNKEQAGQVLYSGIMGGLGYTKNKEQFQELAHRLLLQVLQNLCWGKPFEEQVNMLRALLSSMSGLLPEQECPVYFPNYSEPMKASCWRLFRVRPENHPVRRIGGTACLLARYMERGLLDGAMRLIGEAGSDTE